MLLGFNVKNLLSTEIQFVVVKGLPVVGDVVYIQNDEWKKHGLLEGDKGEVVELSTNGKLVVDFDSSNRGRLRTLVLPEKIRSTPPYHMCRDQRFPIRVSFIRKWSILFGGLKFSCPNKFGRK